MMTPKPLKRIVVVGGTHGNEYTGVWCVKSLEATRSEWAGRYPSLDVSTEIGNPEAFFANRRFLESDLNRLFADAPRSKDDDVAVDTDTVEARRAVDLRASLGGDTTDVLVDLHTTTTNMGVTLIVREGDPVMAHAAAYVMDRCNRDRRRIGGAACRVLAHSYSREDHPSLSSVGRHGLTIEVGPVPQGLLRHDVVEDTQRALDAALEFLERHNRDPEEVRTYLRRRYGGGALRDLSRRISGRGPSSSSVLVPCYRSAPAARAGEMSSKISWPCDDDNPNFPALLVHRSVQDRDFRTLRRGDPLFVGLDGSVVPYDGSHGDEVVLMFVNEGGYYYRSSGTGIVVAEKTAFDLDSGRMVTTTGNRGGATNADVVTAASDVAWTLVVLRVVWLLLRSTLRR